MVYVRDLSGRKAFGDLVVEELLVGRYFVELLKVDLVEPLWDEDHMGYHHFLDLVALDSPMLENLLLVESSSLGHLVPDLLQISLSLLVEALQEWIVEFWVVDQLLDDESGVITDKLVVVKGGGTNFMGNVFIEGEDLLFKFVFDDKVGGLDQFIEDGDFWSDSLVEADLLKYVTDLLEILTVVDVVAVVKHPVGQQVIDDEVVQ